MQFEVLCTLPVPSFLSALVGRLARETDIKKTVLVPVQKYKYFLQWENLFLGTYL